MPGLVPDDKSVLVIRMFVVYCFGGKGKGGRGLKNFFAPKKGGWGGLNRGFLVSQPFFFCSILFRCQYPYWNFNDSLLQVRDF